MALPPAKNDTCHWFVQRKGCTVRTLSRFFFLALLCAVCGAVPACAQQWTQPTPEELSMTSQPQVPGAAAVYLYREQTTDDFMHVHFLYIVL